jgi:hypothetical protein
MKWKTRIGILLLMPLISGCWASKTVMTSANITQPLLVGKVITIGGGKIESNSSMEGTKFSAALVNSMSVWSTGYYYGSNTVREGSNFIDKQLLPLIDESATSGNSLLIVDQLRYDVMCGYWLFYLYTGNKGWLDGFKYAGFPNENNK